MKKMKNYWNYVLDDQKRFNTLVFIIACSFVFLINCLGFWMYINNY